MTDMTDTTGGTAPLQGRIALVAGATRGAGRGIALELAAAGATVYATGRSTTGRPSEYGRGETIEQTAELAAGLPGRVVPVVVDHLDPARVEALCARIDTEQGRLDVLVNDIFGGDPLTEWLRPVWEHSLDDGLRLLRLAIDTHIVTARFAFPLLVREPGGLVVEVTDGTAEYNAENYRLTVYYDLAKVAPIRLARSWAHELREHGGTAVAVTPGWLRSEAMLDHYGVTEETWRDALTTVPHFAISETPRFVGRGIAALAADPDRARWTGRSTSSGELAKVYGVDDLDGSRPDAWRYVVEVQDPGKPADTTGYR
ncbi:SDR family oxidoreductase [Pseudonocardia kujensis]|uniref:SDR family oxidoreductase n=1 Tax=Pseudonocardia kujensis TaxID=1128675 RepID=UPI001E3D7E7B|nr:SDR family oxidoreductase [Pseudonocardia kujensis]MCE0763804.1 SDR family oxidoreductase [Pseudonocardia kujensis]